MQTAFCQVKNLSWESRLVTVQRDAIARWEANNREPSFTNLVALGKALGADCTAFTVAPTDTTERRPGRPKKGAGE
jgi:hypothetical protein